MSDRISRREFGAGVLSSLASLPFLRDKTLESSRFGGVHIGVQSYTFRLFSIDKMIAAMSSLGLSGVELWDGHLNPGKASEAEFKAVRKKFDDAGIRVTAYCVNFPLDSSDEYVDRGFSGALLLGTNVMTASVKKAIVPRLDQWCQKYKIKLGLHNHCFSDKWFKGDRTKEFETPDDFKNALKDSSEFMSINLDIGHFFAAGYDPVSYFKEHHNRIVSLHVKDRDKDAEHTNRLFGQGATPIAECLRLVKALKWPYAANIEYELDPQDPTEPVRICLGYVKKVLS
jgi:sugar phosphate isomerase/epimerase